VTAAEIQAALAVFQILEPQAQKAIAGLIHLFHQKQVGSAADYIAAAQALLNAQSKPAGS
jgi:hypothetical protein